MLRRLLFCIAITALSTLPFLQIQSQSGHVAAQKVSTVKVATTSVAKPVQVSSVPIPVHSAPVVQPTVTPAPTPTAPPLSPHDALMAAAGIAESDWPYASEIVQLESSWNPYAVEPSSDSCHLEQSLPCSKDGCSAADEVCQLEWMKSYVDARYNGFYNALQWHLHHGWY